MAGVEAVTRSFAQGQARFASSAALRSGTQGGAVPGVLPTTRQSLFIHGPSHAYTRSQSRNRAARLSANLRRSTESRCKSKPHLPSIVSHPFPASAPLPPAKVPSRSRGLQAAMPNSSDQLVPSSQVIDAADYQVQQKRIETIMQKLQELDPGIPPSEEAAVRADLNRLSAEHLSLVENNTGENRNIRTWLALMKRLLVLKTRDVGDKVGRNDHKRVWLAEQKLLKVLGWAGRLREAVARLFSWRGLLLFGVFLLTAVSVNFVWRPRAKIVTQPVHYSQFLQQVGWRRLKS